MSEPGGELRSAVTVRLANDAPTDLPPDAGGNPFGLPPGTNRMYLSIYSPWEFTSAELDGEPIGMEAERELGWNVYSTFVDIPAGGEVEVRLGFAGTLPRGRAVLRHVALAGPGLPGRRAHRRPHDRRRRARPEPRPAVRCRDVHRRALMYLWM